MGDVGKNITIIEVDRNINVAMFVNANYGTITRAVNKYTVKLGNKTTTAGKTLGFGGIAYTNYGTISYSANYAGFMLTSSNMLGGGIVASNTEKGVIDGCAFKAPYITIDLNNTAASRLIANIGGIAGQNVKGMISHSYSQTDMKATSAGIASNITLNFGGLVGSTTGTNITYSFVDVTRNSASIIDIYQIVGAISSPTVNGSTCYYKNISTFLSGGDGVFAPQTYTTRPTNLNANGTYFTETVNITPSLEWEADFAEDWDDARK